MLTDAAVRVTPPETQPGIYLDCWILFIGGVEVILLINITHNDTICTNLLVHWSFMHPGGVWGRGKENVH